jgi:hypothetical protein
MFLLKWVKPNCQLEPILLLWVADISSKERRAKNKRSRSNLFTQLIWALNDPNQSSSQLRIDLKGVQVISVTSQLISLLSNDLKLCGSSIRTASSKRKGEKKRHTTWWISGGKLAPGSKAKFNGRKNIPISHLILKRREASLGLISSQKTSILKLTLHRTIPPLMKVKLRKKMKQP